MKQFCGLFISNLLHESVEHFGFEADDAEATSEFRHGRNIGAIPNRGAGKPEKFAGASASAQERDDFEKVGDSLFGRERKGGSRRKVPTAKKSFAVRRGQINPIWA